MYNLSDLVLNCPKVNYKLNYKPGFILCPKTKQWVNYDDIKHKVINYSKMTLKEKI